MTADLDAELEQATRTAFARMFGVIEVTRPEERPTGETTVVALDTWESDPLGGRGGARRRRHRLLAVAAVVAVAAAVVAVVVLPDRMSSDDVSTTEPSATTSSSTTTSSTTSTTSTTSSGGPVTVTSPEGAVSPVPGGDVDGVVVRDAEMLDALDPATTVLPLDQLRDVATVEGNGPATLQVVDDGTRIGLQLSSTWAVGFSPSVEGTPHELERYWMVSAMDNQFMVWGLVPGDVARVTVFTEDGQQVSAQTLPVGAPEVQVRAFVLILPPLAYIGGMSGERDDGTPVLAGTEIESSLVRFQQHSPMLKEWTGFVPVVQH
ncbi:MAG TPA: hypothetical protein VGO78_13440 [Acidimicrobiales bacterium]|nr:hypothetical protein [Acidimicrobiales bacterium]